GWPRAASRRAGRGDVGIRRGSAWRRSSHIQQRGLLDMPGEHLQELRIQAGAPHRQRVADQPQCQAWQPQLQAQADHGRQGAVEDRHVAWRTAEQDRLGQRAVQRHLEAEDEFALAVHATTAPPAKLKKLRKNEDAAKAIDRPKTIWISLRNPPLVSPKASVRPVVMMMITAMMRATGPCTESRRSEEHTSELQSRE